MNCVPAVNVRDGILETIVVLKEAKTLSVASDSEPAQHGDRWMGIIVWRSIDPKSAEGQRSGTSTRYGNGGLLRTALLHRPAKSHDKLIYKIRTEYIRVGERSKTIFALNHGWEARNVSPAGSRIACKVIREIVVRPKKTRRPFAFLRLHKIAIGHKLVFRERTSSTDA